MNNQYNKVIEETIGDLDHLTPELLQVFMDKTMKELLSLIEQFKSANPQEREKAETAALAIRAALEVQVERLSNTMGISPLQLEVLSTNAIAAGTPEHALLVKADEQIEALKAASPKKKVRRNNIINLIG